MEPGTTAMFSRGSAAKCDEQFITRSELSRRLQKSLRTVNYWMKDGILPYYKVRRSVVFRWSEVEEALAGRWRRGLKEGEELQ